MRASVENGFVFGGKIFADNSDEIHAGKKTGGEREISGGAADGAFHSAERSFDGIETLQNQQQARTCSAFPQD